ncbi:STAS domain-containing protein [Nocardiopsis ansamitocini]|uniref:Anti-sigma factor antagonist n=1 Tax=Nocardiopsis ansamitocini TaxID=1670832 RepID=A0A9W6PAE3_9ACTN|nr:STAS domain-containing protein [Nocardiopsis ansamitocini]GLU50085.1 hypothetical protein Nans01_44360 [Nocardiopsis ansamitocini]
MKVLESTKGTGYFCTARLSVTRRPGRTVARIEGEIDNGTAPALRRRLANLLRPDTGLLVLDLSGVLFCDASGLSVLVTTQNRASELGVRLRLAEPPAQTALVLRITNLDLSLSVYPTVRAALADEGKHQRAAPAYPPFSPPPATSTSPSR